MYLFILSLCPFLFSFPFWLSYWFHFLLSVICWCIYTGQFHTFLFSFSFLWILKDILPSRINMFLCLFSLRFFASLSAWELQRNYFLKERWSGSSFLIFSTFFSFSFFLFLFLVYKHGLGKRNVSLRLYNSCVHHIYTFVYINYYLLDITKVSSCVLLSHMHKSELRRGGGKWFLLRTNLYTLIISTLALSQALFCRSCPVLSTSPSCPPSLLASLAPSTPTFPIGPIHTSAKVP